MAKKQVTKETKKKPLAQSAKVKTDKNAPGLFDESTPTIEKPAAREPEKKKVAETSPEVTPKARATQAQPPKMPLLEPIVPAETLEPQAETPAKKSKKNQITYVDAETMAKSQREISVSEFFAKNRHLLGFDNPRKALMTTIKEAVDNSLDACEEAGILPEIDVVIKQLTEDRFEVTVQDNGPGIVKAQVPNIFGRLLYGSKFHKLKMSRGQQGIGISAAGMYGLLTTGKPIRVVSKTGAKKPAFYYELAIDTKKNRPDIIKEDETEFPHDHGTRVSIELQAKYQRGKTSVDEYLKQTALANSHATFRYTMPDNTTIEFARSTDELPPQPKAIKPHPYGVELGVLIKMLQESEHRHLKDFLMESFSKVSSKVADDIIKEAKLRPNSDTRRIGRTEADELFQAINRVKIPPPATDCIVPIGEESLLKGLQSIIKAEFYTAVTRPPAVYRGNAFVIEVALSYGKPEETQDNSGEQQELTLDEQQKQLEAQLEQVDEEDTEMVRLIRFANRVPLLYQQSACVTYKSIVSTNWRSYGLQQSRGSLPVGNAAIIVHIASVWVPFTSESKEAVAHYPEIIKELKLAIQECGRRLGRYLKRQSRVYDELKKRSYIEKYIPLIGEALKEILELPENKIDKVVTDLKRILENSRKM